MLTEGQIKDAIDNDTLTSALRGRMDAAFKTGEELVKSHRESLAHALFSSGITLIPSDHLLDHQFVVSQGVYDAAKHIHKG